MPASGKDFSVYSQPVVTHNSVIYRHKNIVYCRSIFTGELRGRTIWAAASPGRVERNGSIRRKTCWSRTAWCSRRCTRRGPTLVALDETTGQLRWAYGPMIAATKEESQMRFEAAPAGGPRTMYAGYVLDDIEGDTHIDTEYGLMAFESTTGRIQWRRPVCRMRPGEFSGQVGENRRNLIRSLTSPPALPRARFTTTQQRRGGRRRGWRCPGGSSG